ncbi:MAG: hypothetical protein [Bacteriophage sp.]|nr:MAG: hypothetical protein [Bacteriophage sp.]
MSSSSFLICLNINNDINITKLLLNLPVEFVKEINESNGNIDSVTEEKILSNIKPAIELNLRSFTLNKTLNSPLDIKINKIIPINEKILIHCNEPLNSVMKAYTIYYDTDLDEVGLFKEFSSLIDYLITLRNVDLNFSQAINRLIKKLNFIFESPDIYIPVRLLNKWIEDSNKFKENVNFIIEKNENVIKAITHSSEILTLLVSGIDILDGLE